LNRRKSLLLSEQPASVFFFTVVSDLFPGDLLRPLRLLTEDVEALHVINGAEHNGPVDTRDGVDRCRLGQDPQ
jgi:hypothetical protein